MKRNKWKGTSLVIGLWSGITILISVLDVVTIGLLAADYMTIQNLSGQSISSTTPTPNFTIPTVRNQRSNNNNNSGFNAIMCFVHLSI